MLEKWKLLLLKMKMIIFSDLQAFSHKQEAKLVSGVLDYMVQMSTVQFVIGGPDDEEPDSQDLHM